MGCNAKKIGTAVPNRSSDYWSCICISNNVIEYNCTWFRAAVTYSTVVCCLSSLYSWHISWRGIWRLACWLQLDLNFSNETNFIFLAYFITWPQMTFELGMWPLTSLTYESSHVAFMTQVWLQLDFTVSKKTSHSCRSKSLVIIWPKYANALIIIIVKMEIRPNMVQW